MPPSVRRNERKEPFSVHIQTIIWVFPKIGVPQNGWFIIKNPIKMDDLGLPPFLETPISRQDSRLKVKLHRKTPANQMSLKIGAH